VAIRLLPPLAGFLSDKRVMPEATAFFYSLCEKCGLTQLSQLRTFFGLFALIFIVKACVFIGAFPENGRVETKCLPFDNGVLAVCR
jgi:hypothetical protein